MDSGQAAPYLKTLALKLAGRPKPEPGRIGKVAHSAQIMVAQKKQAVR